jgi:hypothetical protein
MLGNASLCSAWTKVLFEEVIGASGPLFGGGVHDGACRSLDRDVTSILPRIVRVKFFPRIRQPLNQPGWLTTQLI